MNAKEYLEQVEKIDKMIENKQAEAEQWFAMAMSSTAPMDGKERVQSSGSQQKMADAIDRYVDIQKEIDSEIDRLVETKRKVIKTIEQLPAIEYDVLHKIYIQYKDFKEVSDYHNKAYTWATTIHGRALKHLQDILNKRGESDD